MRKIWFFVAPILVLAAAGLSQYRFRRNNSHETYSKVASTMVADWKSRSFTPLTDPSPLRSALVFSEGAKLDGPQTDLLLKTVGAWFRAYSAGTESDYLAFRFPEGVEWEWKPEAMGALSNYFVGGRVFESEELENRWIQKYGHPDRIESFVPFRQNRHKPITQQSPQELAEIRQRWIKAYGPGVAAPPIPQTPIERWKQMAFDSSGENWFSGYWTGYSPKDTQVQIYRTNSLPTPLQKRQFGEAFKSRSFGVDAGFENLGIAVLHAASLVQWRVSYADLLQTAGNLLIADVRTLINQSPPESPRPMLLRLVFREDKKRWVPYELVEGSVRDTHNRYAFW